MTRPSSPYSPFGNPAQGDTRQAADARLRAAQGRYEAALERYGNAMTLAAHPSLTDLTAAEIEAMPMSDFARLRERAGLINPNPYDAADDRTPAGPPTPADTAVHGAYVEDVPDFGRMTMTDYAALRARYIRPSYTTRGIFD